MLVRGLFARCEGREHASDPDWIRVDDVGSCRDIPEGTLAVAQERESWELFWCREQEVLRRLAHGTRAAIESETREVVLFGIPGGPGGATGTVGWRFDEGSLHRATSEGVFRLMLQPGGRGSLVFVRHDSAVVFLGQDQRDALIHTAEQRLAEHEGAPLHAWFMGRRLQLRGLGVSGVVGQAELARDVRIVLVRVEQDLYELYIATGRDVYDLIGVYTSADLLRGDLGGILVSGPAQRRPTHTEHAPPPRAPAEPASEPPTPTPPPAPASTRSAPSPRSAPSAITDDDLRRLATCLTLGVFVGEGSSVIKYIYDGFRILVTEGREDELLRTKTLRKLIEKRLKVEIPGVHRTYMRALTRFLEITGLGRLEGRRVRIFFGGLRRGDSEVVATLRERFPAAASAAAAPASPVTPPTAAPPTAQTTTPPTVGNTPPTVGSTGTTAPTAPPTAQTATPPTASTGTAPPTAQSSATTTATPSVDAPSTAQPPIATDAAPPDASMLIDETQTIDSGGSESEPSTGRWRSALSRDGPTYWQRVYTNSAPDDPSQFPGVKPREPNKS